MEMELKDMVHLISDYYHLNEFEVENWNYDYIIQTYKVMCKEIEELSE